MRARVGARGPARASAALLSALAALPAAAQPRRVFHSEVEVGAVHFEAGVAMLRRPPQDVLQARVAAFRRCHLAAMARARAPISGQVQLRFSLGAGGRVVGPVIANGPVGSPQVGRCLAAVVRATQFPRATARPVALVAELSVRGGTGDDPAE